MKVTAANADIPEWLHPHMKQFCDCGGVFCDDGPVGPDGVMKLTQRWCSNPYCPHHMAEKIVKLAEHFEISGVGSKTAYADIKLFGYKHHLDVLRQWFVEKPSVYLYESAELAYIYGVDTKWKEWLGSYSSYEDYLQNEKYIATPVLENLEYLKKCTEYFNIRTDVLHKVVIKIMVSGSIRGFTNRNQFFAVVNEMYKDILRVEDNKKTVRDTMCLVIEPGSTDYDKTRIAREHNIPILSSAEFLQILENVKKEALHEDS